jgi:hypothetical protein
MLTSSTRRLVFQCLSPSTSALRVVCSSAPRYLPAKHYSSTQTQQQQQVKLDDLPPEAHPLNMLDEADDAARKMHFRVNPIPHPLYPKPEHLQPSKAVQNAAASEWDNPFHHGIWTKDEVNGVEQTHEQPNDWIDRLAYNGVRLVRFGFDLFSGYLFGGITTSKLLTRIVFLETVAGIPGMVAGALRHLRSLRTVRRDYGWIHTLLEEAENERMHLMIFKVSIDSQTQQQPK